MAEPAGGAVQAEAQNVDEVLARLADIIARARALRSPLGYFPALYRQVTLQVKLAIERGFFDDGPRMARLDTVFANRYLAAHQTFAGGGQASRCWQIAFEATRGNRLIILQDLLLGINAHINFDLGIAAAEVAPGQAIDALHGDFDKINQLLAAMLPQVEAVIGRFSPLIGLLDQIGGRDETQVLNFDLEAARLDSWNHALVLAHLPQPIWPAALDALDTKVTFLAKLIAEPGGLADKAVEMIRLSESIDRVAILDALASLAGPAAAPPTPEKPAGPPENKRPRRVAGASGVGLSGVGFPTFRGLDRQRLTLRTLWRIPLTRTPPPPNRVYLNPLDHLLSGRLPNRQVPARPAPWAAHASLEPPRRSLERSAWSDGAMVQDGRALVNQTVACLACNRRQAHAVP